MLHLELFSDPLLHQPHHQRLRDSNGAEAVIYDEELLKPALFLADSITLHSYRLDAQHSTLIEANSLRYGVPLTSRIKYFVLGERDELARASGIDQILDELKKVAIDFFDNDGYISLDILDTDIANRFGNLLFTYYRDAYETFGGKSFQRLKDTGVLLEQPWDRRDYSQFSVPRSSWEITTNSYKKGFSHIIQSLDGDPSSIMVDAGIGSLLTDADVYEGWKSLTVLRNAADLMSIIDGLAEAPLDEIVDIREEFSEYLSPFRQFIVNAAREIEVDESVPNAERARILKIEWESKVAPAIDEVKALVKAQTFRRNAFEVLLDRSEASTALGMGIATSLGASVAGFTGYEGIAAGGASLLTGVVQAYFKSRREAKSNPTYFIYELDKRLRKRGLVLGNDRH